MINRNSKNLHMESGFAIDVRAGHADDMHIYVVLFNDDEMIYIDYYRDDICVNNRNPDALAYKYNRSSETIEEDTRGYILRIKDSGTWKFLDSDEFNSFWLVLSSDISYYLSIENPDDLVDHNTILPRVQRGTLGFKDWEEIVAYNPKFYQLSPEIVE